MVLRACYPNLGSIYLDHCSAQRFVNASMVREDFALSFKGDTRFSVIAIAVLLAVGTATVSVGAFYHESGTLIVPRLLTPSGGDAELVHFIKPLSQVLRISAASGSSAICFSVAICNRFININPLIMCGFFSGEASHSHIMAFSLHRNITIMGFNAKLRHI